MELTKEQKDIFRKRFEFYQSAEFITSEERELGSHMYLKGVADTLQELGVDVMRLFDKEDSE